ncbi:transposase [Hyphomicrobiales bacterium 4NK60-0047b]
MRDRPTRHQNAAERSVKDIRRKTRKRYSSEDKIRFVLAGLRGEDSIAELCRQEAKDLKEVVAEQVLELRLLKKSMIGDGEDIE